MNISKLVQMDIPAKQSLLLNISIHLKPLKPSCLTGRFRSSFLHFSDISTPRCFGQKKLPGDSFARSKGSSKRPLEGLQVLEVTGDGDGWVTFGELWMFHAFFGGKSFQALMLGNEFVIGFVFPSGELDGVVFYEFHP